MQPRCYHIVEQVKGWLDMNRAGFDRPGAITGMRSALTNRDGAVLMPRHGPVRFERLVEPDGANRSRAHEIMVHNSGHLRDYQGEGRVFQRKARAGMNLAHGA
jgi:hypothetical protein